MLRICSKKTSLSGHFYAEEGKGACAERHPATSELADLGQIYF